jgi:hypothetical protein
MIPASTFKIEALGGGRVFKKHKIHTRRESVELGRSAASADRVELCVVDKHFPNSPFRVGFVMQNPFAARSRGFGPHAAPAKRLATALALASARLTDSSD